MILVLSDRFDAHADLVCSKISQNKIPFFRFDLDTDSLRDTLVTFNNGSWEIFQNNLMLKSSSVECVWVRRPFVEVSLEDESLNDPSFKIWRGEWNKTLLGLYNSLKLVKWLNPLAKAYQAENKYLQMDYAKKIGFLMPPTIISNEKCKLMDFAKTHGDVVMKLMNQEFYKDHDGEFKGLYVNKLTLNDLSSFGDSKENPIVLQAYVDKAYEVRYTVVGDDHHVCKIDSQKSQIASIDWRRYDIPNTPHSPITPPDYIKQKVSELLKSLDLYFGALDFIVSPSNEWYFLEINTMGQWLWIETLTDLGISDSIVEFLTTAREG